MISPLSGQADPLVCHILLDFFIYYFYFKFLFKAV